MIKLPLNKPGLSDLDFLSCFSSKQASSVLIQEDAGFHLGISRDLKQAGRQVAGSLKEHYEQWCESGWERADTSYKYEYFTIGVGGGNTLKAVYQALLDIYVLDIEWLKDVRFFLLEESTGENKLESAEKSLIENFIAPLCDTYIRSKGKRALAAELELPGTAEKKSIKARMVELMVSGFNMAATKKALRNNDQASAVKLAKKEASRYQQDLQSKLGEELAFHLIISGIAKDGGIGAFNAYNSALKITEPGVAVLKQENGALRLALNRGVLVNAARIYLIIAGSTKLRALGRFEMEDMKSFEQSVLETPIRMLRQTREMAQKVTIFADDRALHFDEDVYSYRSRGESYETKAETRAGLEEDGVHILLLHGFMGLYTYINFLVRLPSSWTVSALRRGNVSTTMREEDIFPQYGANLRHAILKNWRHGAPSPVGFHSIAGVISDHLLLTIVGNEGDIPDFEKLNKGDQQLVQALRCGGMIHMASWAPSDVSHIEATIDSLVSHRRHDTPMSFAGPERVYSLDEDNRLQLSNFDESGIVKSTRFLSVLLKIPGTESLIRLVNIAIRFAVGRVDVHNRLEREHIPYALRLIGGRLISKVSFFGLFKEVVAALHDPGEYQLRHMRALEVILAYDIPYLSIIHQDDSMVSARRHAEEHEYLLRRRMEKENVSAEAELKIPVRFLLVQRDEPDKPPQADALNPHLMLMSTDKAGEKLSRRVTAAITRFVNENVDRAVKRKLTRPLPSVRKWMKQNPKP